jgi:hypothetical protein
MYHVTLRRGVSPREEAGALVVGWASIFEPHLLVVYAYLIHVTTLLANLILRLATYVLTLFRFHVVQDRPAVLHGR